MIDLEQDIFNALYSDVSPLCAKNGFRSVHTPAPTALPTATLFEMDNRTTRDLRSSNTQEEYATVTYEAHVYAQSKSECRKVFAALDEGMTRRNFNRFSGAYTPNLANTKVHEYVARYQAIVDRAGNIYRRS